jgi:RHS repeat-associated protein
VLLARYTHGEEIDQPLAMARDTDADGQLGAAESFFYHTDHLGSIRLVTDAAGAVANRYDYDAFGGWEATSYETVANPFGFTARERDAESGLMFYRARYYDPKIGRFISQDPIGFEGKDLNLYRYVFNGPVIAIDPFGQVLFRLGYGFAAASAFAGAQLGALAGALWELVFNPNDVSACTVIAAAASGAFLGAALGAFAIVLEALHIAIHLGLHVALHEGVAYACEGML